MWEGGLVSIITSFHRVCCRYCLALELAWVAALAGVTWTGLTYAAPPEKRRIYAADVAAPLSRFMVWRRNASVQTALHRKQWTELFSHHLPIHKFKLESLLRFVFRINCGVIFGEAM